MISPGIFFHKRVFEALAEQVVVTVYSTASLGGFVGSGGIEPSFGSTGFKAISQVFAFQLWSINVLQRISCFTQVFPYYA